MRYLYLHGFASGPGSKKGVAFEEHFAGRGIAIERLNLRVPSFEHLRLSAMIDHVRETLGPDDRAVVIGSSLGGLTAARVAERDPRVAALVLMAPAFHIAQRWRAMLGTELERWQASGWREVADYTTGAMSRIDFGFFEDLISVDVGEPDVRVPTLIFHGEHDDTVPVGHSREFARRHAGVHLVELDDGHELVDSLPALLSGTEAFLEEQRLLSRAQ